MSSPVMHVYVNNEELIERLDRIAEKEDRSRSYMAMKAVEEFVERYEKNEEK